MFNQLSNNLSKIFAKLKGKGHISEEDFNLSIREIRVALLEADVALPVVKDLIERIKTKIVGSELFKNISAAQMIVKIVQDELTEILGSNAKELNISSNPAVILLLGLQGSGKTTSCAKLAFHIRKTSKKKVLLASGDASRPAAKEQLEALAKQIGVDCLSIIKDESPINTASRALKEAKIGAYDVLIFDTAGRLHTDENLMTEISSIEKTLSPAEKLIALDCMTGQDAVNIGKSFAATVALTGIILTRVDGDARGGAALSITHMTQCPIKFIGTGEKINELEIFHPERAASRILGMGDVVSLVEKALDTIGEEEVQSMTSKLASGKFNINDLLLQLKSLKKLGGFSSMLGMMPGLGKLKSSMGDLDFAEKSVNKQIAIINSMTLKERNNPDIISPSRKVRIAKGSAVEVHEVNKLLKQFVQMGKMAKKFGKMDDGQLKNFAKKFNI